MEQNHDGEEYIAPAADLSEAEIIAEVAAVAAETGLVEASKTADRMADEYRTPEILRKVAHEVLKGGMLDPKTRHDLLIARMASQRSAANAVETYGTLRASRIKRMRQQADIALEIAVRREARRKPSA